jgi:hypothetical protein
VTPDLILGDCYGGDQYDLDRFGNMKMPTIITVPALPTALKLLSCIVRDYRVFFATKERAILPLMFDMSINDVRTAVCAKDLSMTVTFFAGQAHKLLTVWFQD